jgi:hypothetical protein
VSTDELLERITIDPNLCFGKPTVCGTRIWVVSSSGSLPTACPWMIFSRSIRRSPRATFGPALPSGPVLRTDTSSTWRETEARREPEHSAFESSSQVGHDVDTVASEGAWNGSEWLPAANS